MPTAKDQESLFLRALLVDPLRYKHLALRAYPEWFSDSTNATIFYHYRSILTKFGYFALNALLDAIPDYQDKITRLLLEDLAPEAECLYSLESLRNNYFNSQRQQLIRQVSQKEIAYDELTKGLVSIANDERVSSYQAPSYDPIDALKERIQRKQGTDIVYDGFLTGYPIFDQTLNGLKQRQLTVIGARPGVGKTAFVINLMDSLARQGIKNVLLSYEMKEEEIYERMFWMYGVSQSYFQNNNLSTESLEKINRTADYLKEMRNVMKVDGSLTMYLELRSLLQDYKHKGYDVIFIDYLQRIKAVGFEHLTEAASIGLVTGMLAEAARSLDLAIVSLAQLNRNVTHRSSDNRRPRVEDLRGSGEIEQDADNILLLHRLEGSRYCELIAGKVRSGEAGGITEFDYNAVNQIFTEIGKVEKEQEDERGISKKDNEARGVKSASYAGARGRFHRDTED